MIMRAELNFKQWRMRSRFFSRRGFSVFLCLKKRLSKDQWRFDINFRPRSCNRFWTKWILGKRNLKISETPKTHSDVYWISAGREGGMGGRGWWLSYNRDGNARRKNRIDARKGTVLQQYDQWCLAFLFINFVTHSPKRMNPSCLNWYLYGKNIGFSSWPP